MILDHIGIAVKDLTQGIELYTKILGVGPYKTETVEGQNVKVAFFAAGRESKIELLQGTNTESVISKFVAIKGEGIHHTAYLVDNLESEIKRMISEGFEPLASAPRMGADSKMVFFFHPKSTGGTLIELCAKASSK